jgi:hypothetical protein
MKRQGRNFVSSLKDVTEIKIQDGKYRINNKISNIRDQFHVLPLHLLCLLVLSLLTKHFCKVVHAVKCRGMVTHSLLPASYRT